MTDWRSLMGIRADGVASPSAGQKPSFITRLCACRPRLQRGQCRNLLFTCVSPFLARPPFKHRVGHASKLALGRVSANLGVSTIRARAIPANRTCRVCGDPRHEVAFCKNGYPVLRCRGCGVGHIQPAGFNPEVYYTREYFEGGYSDGYADYGASGGVLRRGVQDHCRAPVAVCPRGRQSARDRLRLRHFLQVARERWQVHGLEISAEAVARCRDAGLAGVWQGMADLELPRFDGWCWACG